MPAPTAPWSPTTRSPHHRVARLGGTCRPWPPASGARDRASGARIACAPTRCGGQAAPRQQPGVSDLRAARASQARGVGRPGAADRDQEDRTAHRHDGERRGGRGPGRAPWPLISPSTASRPVDVPTMVPVNLRPDDQPLPAELGNRFALVLLSLPSGLQTPFERLAETSRRMTAIKESPEAWLTFGMIRWDRAHRADTRALPRRLLRQQGHRRHHQRPRTCIALLPGGGAGDRDDGLGARVRAPDAWHLHLQLRRPSARRVQGRHPHDHRPRGLVAAFDAELVALCGLAPEPRREAAPRS